MDQAQLDGRTIRVNESRPKCEHGAAAGPGGSGTFIIRPEKGGGGYAICRKAIFR
jgi:hypothetical protein